jgi:MFS family permease
MRGQQRHGVLLLYAMVFFSWVSTYLYMPTLPTFSASVGASETMIGWIIGGFGLIQALLRAPLGVLSDLSHRRKIFINIGMLAAFIGPLGMAIWPTPLGLLIFRSISGITAATWAVTTVFFSNYFETDDAPAAIAKCNVANSTGNVCGMLLGGILVGYYGQRFAFFFAAVLGMTAFFISMFLRENPYDNTVPVTFKGLINILKDKYLLKIAFLAFVFQVVITGTSNSFTPIYAETIGADAFQLGLLGMLSMLGMVISAVLRNSLGKMFRSIRDVVTIAFIIYASTTLGIPFCGDIGLLYVLQFTQGLSGYLILIILMGESIVSYKYDKRGAAMGLFQSLFGFGMFSGPVFSGALNSILPLNSIFVIMAFLAAVASGLSYVWLRD